MKIIVDAFGGDNAPQEILLGCAQARADLGVDILSHWGQGPPGSLRQGAGPLSEGCRKPCWNGPRAGRWSLT